MLKKDKKSIDLQAKALEGLCFKKDKCRMCKSDKLKVYLDLGFTPPADQFRTEKELDFPEVSYPLRVVLCMDCGLSQLSHVVDPKVLYQFDYPYESSTTKTGKKHWDEFASKVKKRLNLEKGDLVVDFGSNDGTLLQSFKNEGMKVFGIDPAQNIVKIANQNGIPTICSFFNRKSALEVKKKSGKVKVVLGTNVFAHIDDLDEVMKAANILLHEDGVFIFESPYFGHLVPNLEYDTIYHEHLSYISIKPLVGFFKRFKMEIFAIEESLIHGGSIRVYVGKKGTREISSEVSLFLKKEIENKLHEFSTMENFSRRVADNRKELVDLIEKLISEGKKIVGISAPAKGMTLLNYAGLTERHLKFISEKSKLKIGRFAPGGYGGGYIKIVSDEDLIKEKPDYALLLAWNFADEIMDNLKDFRARGGKFIIPIPKPKII